MKNGRTELQSGLEGIAVAETVLSNVDGARGRLVIAGHDVESLAGCASFEEAAAALWAVDDEGIPKDAVTRALGEGRSAAFALLPTLGAALRAPDAMDGLRAAVAHLVEATGTRERWEPHARIAAAVAVFAAAWARLREGHVALAPDPSLGHAADYLRMLRGAAAMPHEISALEAYLVAVVDHGLNASTFAARVVASTGSDLVSAVTAAIGALKGPLHGGAPGPVLDMLDLVGAPERARTVLEHEIEARRRIMGMGHRVYRVRDPRAAVSHRRREQHSRGERRSAARTRARGRARRDGVARRPLPEPGPPRERRVLHGRPAGGDRRPPGAVQRDVRRSALGGMDGSHRRGAAEGTADPPDVHLRRRHASGEGRRDGMTRLRSVSRG